MGKKSTYKAPPIPGWDIKPRPPGGYGSKSEGRPYPSSRRRKGVMSAYDRDAAKEHNRSRKK